VTFRPSLKCCTHHPTLPNFLVGGILASGGEGAALVVELLFPEASRWLKERPSGFGRDETCRCPFLLEEGRCGIWKHRYSVCATWFCQHVPSVGRAKYLEHSARHEHE
jgi:Fe-S-cluster containining protein